MLRNRTLSILLATAMLWACNGEGAVVDTDIGTGTETDTGTDTGTGTDAVTDAGGTIETAFEMKLTFGEYTQRVDAISEPGDRDFYKFNVLKGNWYILWAHSNNLDATTQLPAGNPDTVIRIYDGDGKMVDEIDDMPTRIQETDAGHIMQATEDGVMYVEVMEWSDWADDGPQGSPSMVYRMSIGEFDIGDNLETNDTTEETIAAQADGGFSWSVNPFDPNPDEASFPYWGHGAIDQPGDTDVYMVTSSGGYFVQFGFWPAATTLLTPEYTVWWEDCTLGEEDYGDCDGKEVEQVAHNTDPDMHPDGFGKEDSGAMIYTRPGVYYVQVADAGGKGDAGYFYSNLYNAFSYLEELFVAELESDSTDPEAGIDLVHRSFDSTTWGNDSSQAFFYGDFEPISKEVDNFDAYNIGPYTVEGKHLNVWLDAADDGSMAGELTLEVVRKDGDSWKVVATDTGVDPSIVDYKVTADDNKLYVVVKSDGKVQGHSAFYNGRLYVTENAINP
ncbi:MAG: hypothetical protein ACI9MC_000155 [Kiritimatiellia bacterium]|jgi:hypothetical protein